VTSRLPVSWGPRDRPLPPSAVVAVGPVAASLLRRLSEPGRTEGLQGVVAGSPADLVVLVGEDLPWVDGVVYLGRDPLADGVLVPTNRAPDAPIDLVARAARAAVAGRTGDGGSGDAGSRHGGGLIAVIPGVGLVPLGGARPVDAAFVRAALRSASG